MSFVALLLLIGATAPNEGPATAESAVRQARSRLQAALNQYVANGKEAAPLNLPGGDVDVQTQAVHLVATVIEDVRRWMTASDAELARLVATDPSPLEQFEDPYLQAALKLYFARRLVRADYVEQSLTLINGVKSTHVADRAALHFYRAAGHYRLQNKKEALEELDALEAIPTAPKRFLVTAALMRRELEALEKAELDGIAHDMRDVTRRLDLGRTDDQVVELEKDILKRLNKLIDQMEQQLKNQSAQQSSGSQRSTRPMDDSLLPAGGQTPGKVGNRVFKDVDQWGNLPERERQRVLQDIGRQFPPHYRDAIEQYFRKLADTPSGN